MTTAADYLEAIRDARQRILALRQSMANRLLSLKESTPGAVSDQQVDEVNLDVELAKVALAEAELAILEAGQA